MIRQEQCDKVCRILDDVLANRPTERDSLIVATRKAFEALEEPQWIPIKMIPMDEEERAYWSEHIGYDVEYAGAVRFDCKMPDDRQEIWVQTKNGLVYEDVCEDDGGWFGLEGNGDWLDIVAWMPKYIPEPWEGEKDERQR